MQEYKYYKKQIKNLNIANEEKIEYQKIIERIGENSKTPIILNTYHMSNVLGVKWKVLKSLIDNTEGMYHTFYISKKSGGKREIDTPNENLMFAQKKIKELILDNINIHESAYGFTKNKNIMDNAQVHLNQEMVLNIDLENFFPSITGKRIYYVFHDLCKYDKKVASCLTKLVTLNDKLPQGAPTSPVLSNIVSYMLDIRLYNLAKKLEINYTRYADDITFSGGKNKVNNSLLKIVTKIIKENEFNLNENKTRFAGKGAKQEVTGLIVNNEKINVPRGYIKEIRKELYYIKKFGIKEHRKYVGFKNKSYREHLLGKILYVRSVNFEKGQELLEKYNDIDW